MEKVLWDQIMIAGTCIAKTEAHNSQAVVLSGVSARSCGQ